MMVGKVVLPLTFMRPVGQVSSRVEDRDRPPGAYGDGCHAMVVAVCVACIVAFGLVMLRLIDRAQRQVVRQNHELAATNALSRAVQGEVGVDRIVDVALESLLATSGAVRASVTIFSGEDRSPDGAGVKRDLLAVHGSAPLVPDDPGGSDAPVIDFPLSTGTVTVGRMRLWLPAGAGTDDRLASGTLQNIGYQLASAIQLAQLFADLERRNHEGRAFHDVLMQISSQSAPADILGSVVGHARDLMVSDQAVRFPGEDASRSGPFPGTIGREPTVGRGGLEGDVRGGAEGGGGGRPRRI